MRDSFQKNSEVEKDKLHTEFEQLKPISKETLVITMVELTPSRQNLYGIKKVSQTIYDGHFREMEQESINGVKHNSTMLWTF